MSIDSYAKQTYETCSDLEKLALLGSKQERTLFSTIAKEDKIYTVLPKNIETVRDSSMISLVTYCAMLRKHEFITTIEEVDRLHIVDTEWQPACSYFQGIIRGITGLLQNKPHLQPLTKTPYSQGVWYVQSRVMNNLKLNNIAILIPKITGIFTYTSTKGKGLTLAENIALVTIVNRVIDDLKICKDLINMLILSPDVLKTRQVLKHKQPSSKKMMYWPGEINYLVKNVTPKLTNLDEPLYDLYKKVIDVISYNNYVDGIKHYNKCYSEITAQPDQIASSRYPILFKKGTKGDQDSRLASLDIDELNKLCPVDWVGLQKPILITRTPAGVALYLRSVDEIEKKINEEFRPAFNDWRLFVSKSPEIIKGVKALEEG